DHHFVIGGAPGQDPAYYHDFRQNATESFPGQIQFLHNETYTLLHFAKAALVTSGTATLETALFEVPQVVCYKGSALSYQIAKRIIQVKYISLVNLILDRPLVRELIQDDYTSANLETALQEILSNEKRKELQQGYSELRQLLGNAGASQRAARLMTGYLKG
ncbi:MAG: lipid-A-disaccharide synthase, partial [Bacteroidota bacterium]